MVVTNYKVGTWLVGWDNTMPELNYRASWNKTFSGIWQEYRGLGLLDGMAHAANVVHLGLIFLLDLILPKSIVRYVFIFLMNLLGGLGSYKLIRKLLNKERDSSVLYQDDNIVSVIGALFYMFNIGVVQMFYIPLELFVIHFGFLPWLIIVLLNLLDKTNKKNIIWFVLVNFLAVSQAHVPSIFIVYGMTVVIFLLFWVLRNKGKSSKDEIKNKLKLVLGLLFAINAFWGIPYFYSALSKAPEIVGSKINQMSNQEIVLRNEAFGDLKSVAMLWGFNFNYYDWDKGLSVPLMNNWLIHFEKFWVRIISLIFFAFSLLGLGLIIKNRRRKLYPIAGIFIFSFLMLGSKIPVLSVVSWVFKNFVPFFADIFRFIFTKFIIVYALSFCVLLSIGLKSLFNFRFLKYKVVKKIFTVALFISLILYALPVWRGEFLYERLRLEVPKEYFEVFDFSKNVDKSRRVAILPSPNYWGWTTNKWGYRGSGFVWYGIEQPLMDRAFDAWGKNNEQYYWELIYSIRVEDKDLFSHVINKYDIDYILYDESIVDTVNGKQINHEKIIKFIEETNGIKSVYDNGYLRIYENQREGSQKDYVTIISDLPNIENDFDFSWKDKAYEEYEDYISHQNQEYDIVYPFSSLFANRLQEDLEFKISETEDSLQILPKKMEDLSGGFVLEIPNILEEEEYISGKLSWQKNENNIMDLKVVFFIPEISFGKNIYYANPTWSGSLDLAKCEDRCFFNLNYVDKINLTEDQGEIETNFYTKRDNVIGLYDGENVNQFDFLLLNLKEEVNLTYSSKASDYENFGVEIKKIKNSNYDLGVLDLGKFKSEAKSCKEYDFGIFEKNEEFIDGKLGFNYKAVGNSSCENIYLENLDHKQGYILKIATENKSGIPFKFGVQNPYVGRSEIDTLLSDKKGLINNWIILPKTESFFKGYSLFFDTVSFGREINENVLNNIEINWFPYNFLKNLKLVSNDFENKEPEYLTGFEVEKKAIWLYKFELNREMLKQAQDDEEMVLKLSQAYHDGWLAFSKNDEGKWQKLTHIKVNNWANGWKLNKNQELRIMNQGKEEVIYIIFWPQILEYVGLGMLIGTFAWIFIKKNKEERNV